ncbi:hypothetical protein [Oceanithermus sp.]
MKKWTGVWALAFVALALTLSACDFSVFTNPIGVPTVSLSVQNVQAQTDPDTGTALSFVIEATPLPGSPAGTVASLTLKINDGETVQEVPLAGFRVEACPVDAAVCTPSSSNVSFLPEGVLLPGSVTLTAYTAVGDNGASFTRTLGEPIVVY